MPRIAKERSDENRRRIEQAAVELFTRQGFHGTNNREIAEKLGVSTGTIYTYFSNKESIFSGVAQRYRTHISVWLTEMASQLKDPLSKAGLKELAFAIQAKMYEEPECFLMLLSDVIEFRNEHFSEFFHDVPQQFRSAMGSVLEEAAGQPGWRGQDPALALASAYLYFFTYFMMERHMHGEQHLGMSSLEATEQFADLLTNGMWKRDENEAPTSHEGRVMGQGDRDRIDYIRFLSGRLWDLPPDMRPTPSEEGEAEEPAKRSILFLPEMPKNRIDENQLRIEASALKLFTHQGFHGTNIRDIAENAGVSQGAIYTYYPSKEAIFEALVGSYRRTMRRFLERLFRVIEDPFSKSFLSLFATAMRSMVFNDGEYWVLMYIDVIEFQSKHFQNAFRDVPAQFRRLLGPTVEAVKKHPGWRGQDPALVMAMIYFYFHTYFVIERLMNGNRHLGVTHEEAVERFIDIVSHGLWNSSALKARSCSAR